MQTIELNRYVELIAPAKERLTGANLARASHAYQQAVAFLLAFRRLEAELPSPLPDLESLSESERESYSRAMWIGWQMDSMLRAVIVFGDVTNLVLLQEVLGVRDREPFVTYLSSKNAPVQLREWTSRLDSDALVAAHALRKYRDQLVMHFGQLRTDMVSWMHDDMKNRRLVPIHFDGATHDAHDSLEQIAKRHRHIARVSNVAEVEPGRHNFWELLEALFYSVRPLDSNHCPSGDRKSVDRLVLHGGVKSPTMSEVFDIVESFAKAVVARITVGDVPSI